MDTLMTEYKQVATEGGDGLRLPLDQQSEKTSPAAETFLDEPDTNEAHEDSLTPASNVDVSRNDSSIGWFDASMHLIKGNLGPGCLNLPHAFAQSGWLVGTTLFGIVALQGIYSMTLLAKLKQDLQQQLRHDNVEGATVQTFMDVAKVTLGRKGQRIVQIFLFILQTGVCCVFLSLLATNLQAELPRLGDITSIFVVTLALLVIVWVRSLKELKWLSTIANAFMVTAILTAATAGIREVRAEELPLPPKGTSDLGHVATFTSSMFFAFEGIGLVLPVENSYVGSQPEKNQAYRTRILPASMSVVGCLFWIIGFASSWGFPDISSGSITAYLAQKFPNQIWFEVVNGLVMVAVFLTFPLQLTPALEVLDDWCSTPRTSSAAQVLPQAIPQDDEVTHPEHELEEAVATCPPNGEAPIPISPASNPSVWKGYAMQYSWILPRYCIVLGCAIVVVVVNDLGLLMALFGAIGQTGLAAMPCLCHLAWQREQNLRHGRPLAQTQTLLDLCTIIFATLVMLFGLVVSVEQIWEKQQRR